MLISVVAYNFNTSFNRHDPMNFMSSNKNTLRSFVIKDIPVRDYFHIKLHDDGHIKSHYLYDIVKHRNKIINMHKDLNPHIFEIFTWDMLLHLHELKISYKSLSKFIIYENTTKLQAECIIISFLDAFHNKDWVLALGHHQHCKFFGFINIYHPKSQQGRPKLFDDDEMEERRKQHQIKWQQSDKGKQSQYNRTKRYRDKQKLLN